MKGRRRTWLPTLFVVWLLLPLLACGTPCLTTDRAREAWLSQHPKTLYPYHTSTLRNPATSDPAIPWLNLVPSWVQIVLTKDAAQTLFCTSNISLQIEESSGTKIVRAQTNDGLLHFGQTAAQRPGERQIRYELFVDGTAPAAWQKGWDNGAFGWEVTVGLPAIEPLTIQQLRALKHYDLSLPQDRQNLYATLPKMFGGYSLATLPKRSWVRQGMLESGTVLFEDGQQSRYLALLPPDLAVSKFSALPSTFPVALFIHGLRACKESWIPAMSVFAALGIASLAMDLPDHGARSFPEGFVCGVSEPFGFWDGFSPAQIALNLERSTREQAAMLSYWKTPGREVSVLAHSLGTMIASRLASIRPNVRYILAAPTGDIATLFATFVPEIGGATDPMARLQAAHLLFPFDLRQIRSHTPLLLQLMGGDTTLGLDASRSALHSMKVRSLGSWKPGTRKNSLAFRHFRNTVQWVDVLKGGDHLSPLLPRRFDNENLLLALQSGIFASSGLPFLDPASPLAAWLASGLIRMAAVQADPKINAP